MSGKMNRGTSGVRPSLAAYVLRSASPLVMLAGWLIAVQFAYSWMPLMPLRAYCRDGFPPQIAGELSQRFRDAYMARVLEGRGYMDQGSGETYFYASPLEIRDGDIRMPFEVWNRNVYFYQTTAQALRDLYRKEHGVSIPYSSQEQTYRAPGRPR